MWKPTYPIRKMPHNVFKDFPDWGVDENSPQALKQAVESLQRINAWQTSMIADLVALYDYLEKERTESQGAIPVKACYVYQKKLVELMLGCPVETAKQFLRDTGFPEEEKATL